MNKNNSLPESMPETTHEFMIDLVGRITKRHFKGEFACKIPTIKDQAMIAKHQAMLNGEYPVYLDGGIQKIHRMIAYLRYTITDSPMFWRNNDLGYDLRDDNIIEAVYDEVIAFENMWLEKIWGVAEITPEQEEKNETEETSGQTGDASEKDPEEA